MTPRERNRPSTDALKLGRDALPPTLSLRAAEAAQVAEHTNAAHDVVVCRDGAGALVIAPLPPVSDELTLGRADDNDLVISWDASVSAHHAVLRRSDSEFTIEDADSTHGTYVNGLRIGGRTPVRPQHPIRVGGTTLTIFRAAV